MIAYLIGGPQDMIKMQVPDSTGSTLAFAHLKAIPVAEVDFDGPVEVEHLRYYRVFEGMQGRERYSIYAFSRQF